MPNLLRVRTQWDGSLTPQLTAAFPAGSLQPSPPEGYWPLSSLGHCQDSVILGSCLTSLHASAFLCVQEELAEHILLNEIIHGEVFVFVFCLFRATTAVHGGSQARGRIGAAAAGLRHSHSNTNPSLVYDPHHSVRQCWILNPLCKARDRTHVLMDTTWLRNLLSHSGNSYINRLLIYHDILVWVTPASLSTRSTKSSNVSDSLIIRKAV